MNKKHFVSILLMLLLVFAMTGCTTDHEREDIVDYVKTTYDFADFSVSEKAEEVTGEDGRTDYHWTIIINDDVGLTFNVVDDYHWCMESVTNSLRDDYKDVAVDYLYNQYATNFTILRLNDEPNPTSDFVGYYTNREELRDLYEEMCSFCEYVHDSGYELDFSMKAVPEFSLRNATEQTITDGDFTFWSTSISDEKYEEAEREYLQMLICYQLKDSLVEFDDDEMCEALANYDERIFIVRDADIDAELTKEDVNWEVYEDLCANRYGYGISFGTLYEILLREGFNVEGNEWHYTFTGINGNVYEIAYDFCDYVFEDGQEGYYYIKNDEIVPMDYYFYNCFRTEQIEGMTGLVLDIKKNVED